MEKKDSKRNWRPGRKAHFIEQPLPPSQSKINIPVGIDPEIVAVIATVLEIELKLLEHSRPGKFTFCRDEPGWTQFGKSLLNPYQGGSRS